MTNHPFDSQIRQKMKGHEAAVPAGTWEAIAAKKKKRRYPLFWWLTGLGILAGGIIILTGTADRQPAAPAAALSGSELRVQKTGATTPGDTFATPSSVGQTTFTTAEESVMKNITDQSTTGRTKRYNRNSDSTLRAQDRQVIAPVQQTVPAQPVYVTTPPVRNDAPGKITIAKAGTGARAAAATIDSLLPPAPTPTPGSVATSLSNKVPADTTTAILASGVPARQPAATTDSTMNAAASSPVRPQLKKPKWSVDISVSPFLPLRQQQSLASVNRTVTGAMYTSVFKADQIKAVLQPSFSYTILLHRTLGKRLQLGAGLQYGMIKEKLELAGTEIHTQYQVLQRLENNTGTPFLRSDTIAVVSSGIRTIRAINSYRFFDIPLSLRYLLIEKPRFTLQLTGAVNLGLYSRYRNAIEGKTEAISAAGLPVSPRPSSFRAGLYTGLRYSRLVWKRTAVFAEPYLHLATGNYTDAISNRPVHRAGIGLGTSFRF
ncbi:MAG: hypothetical protein ABW019_14450 [Chitinophagaceae bacterium]